MQRMSAQRQRAALPNRDALLHKRMFARELVQHDKRLSVSDQLHLRLTRAERRD